MHRAGGFSGDVDLLSGRPVVVTGRARGATRVLELPPDRLRAPRPDGRGAVRDLPARVHPAPDGADGGGQGERRAHRLPPLRADPPAAGVPDAQQRAVRVPRRGDGPGRAGDARRVRAQRRRRARADLPRHARAEEADGGGGGRLPGARRGARRPRARRGRHRRRARRSRRRGLRGVRGARRARPGVERARRPGGIELAHRELPGLPDRHLRPAPRRPRVRAGGEVRRGVRGRAHGGAALLRAPAAPDRRRRRRHGRVALGHRRDRRRSTASPTCPTSRGSRASASTTRPRRWRRTSAAPRT